MIGTGEKVIASKTSVEKHEPAPETSEAFGDNASNKTHELSSNAHNKVKRSSKTDVYGRHVEALHLLLNSPDEIINWGLC